MKYRCTEKTGIRSGRGSRGLRNHALLLLAVAWIGALEPALAQGRIVHETTSAYHRIRVTDRLGLRVLTFDRTEQTRMALVNPLQGHFEYIEFFFMPWLWNQDLENVLMIGLGGGSAQRLYAAYSPSVTVDTVEVDPVVRRVADEFFGFEAGPKQRVFIEDGRVFLRRTSTRYDAILIDAYTEGRYGAAIPHHLATREFFALVRDRLTPNGVVAYNVMGSFAGWRADIVGSMYRTMKTVFPQVYLFPASESLNIVLVGTLSPEAATPAWIQQQAAQLRSTGRMRLPTFNLRLEAFRAQPPANLEQCPVLTDDFAPVGGLLSRP